MILEIKRQKSQNPISFFYKSLISKIHIVEVKKTRKQQQTVQLSKSNLTYWRWKHLFSFQLLFISQFFQL